MKELTTAETYQEEIFCLTYELEALADLTIRKEAERWVPRFMWPGIESEHLLRYKFAAGFVAGLRVLDIACGSGYGSYILAEDGNAAHVTACDICADSLRYGNFRYAHPKVTRSREDATRYRKENYYDAAVSFETIEHLTDYEAFLTNIHASLKAGGLFLVSTPIVPQTRTVCHNPHHVIEWSMLDFQHLVRKYFSIEDRYVQGIVPVPARQFKPVKAYKMLKYALFPDSHPGQKINNTPERFCDQYAPDKILHGYQLLVCRKA